MKKEALIEFLKKQFLKFNPEEHECAITIKRSNNDISIFYDILAKKKRIFVVIAKEYKNGEYNLDKFEIAIVNVGDNFEGFDTVEAPTGKVKLIPLEHYRIIYTSSEGMVSQQDENISSLTIRDLASILLKTPQSNKEFLNEIIKNSNKL